MFLRVAVLLVIILALTACGSAPHVLRYGGSNGDSAKVWPGAESKEVPRYRYIGELTGEKNFGAAEREPSGLRKALHWIVGMNDRLPDPLVLQRPQSGVTDEFGRVYVTDVSRKAVFVFDEVAGKLLVWEMAAPNIRFVSPIGVALGDNGDVLVTDSELRAVFRLDRTGKPVGTLGKDLLLRPTGIARDPQRRLIFVSDTQAHDIKVFNENGQLIETLGQHGEGEGEFNFPTHLAYANARLYVTDMMNSRVQVFDTAHEARLAVGKRGLYVGNLVRPKGVAIDDEGNIYIIESLHDHLLVFNDEGRFLLAIGGTGAGAGQFYLPAGVWTDKRNRIFVADMFNGRVAVFQFLGGR